MLSSRFFSIGALVDLFARDSLASNPILEFSACKRSMRFFGSQAASIVGSVAALLLSVSCGGGSSAVIPAPSPTPLRSPAIAAVWPSNGPSGTSVTIEGTNLSGATAVKLNDVPCRFTMLGLSVQVTVPEGSTSGKFSVTTLGGTAYSASDFIVTTSPSLLDLAIDGTYVTQATQDYPAGSVPLLQDRRSWIRVFLRADRPNAGVTPTVAIELTDGVNTEVLTIGPTASQVPYITNPNYPTSWDAPLPSQWIKPGVRITATVDPANEIPEFDESNNRFSLTPTVRALPPWKVTLVPVRTRDGRTGKIEDATRTRNDWIDLARRIYPVPDDVDVTVGSVMTSSAANLPSDNQENWIKVLSELAAKRALEGVTDRYYFGAVNVAYTAGSAGRAVIGEPLAMGWDGDKFPIILAHEFGHSFGRHHSPCGNTQGDDPKYPYINGMIGVAGWDVFANEDNLKSAGTYSDILSYCFSQVWISDYTFRGVLDYRARHDSSSAAVPSRTETRNTEGLLVWGRIEDDQLVMEPAFAAPWTGAMPQAGPYTWEARDAEGSTLLSVPFAVKDVADALAPAGMFSFVVPIPAEKQQSISSMHVLKDGDELARVVSSLGLPHAREELAVSSLPGGAKQFSWDAQDFPMVLLRDALTGEVLAFLREGSALVQDPPPGLEVHVSDGVHSQEIGTTLPK